MRRIASMFLSCCIAASAHAAEVHLLTAARIHTSDPNQPTATALAWDDAGRVLAVGDAKTLSARYPDAAHIDAGDATVECSPTNRSSRARRCTRVHPTTPRHRHRRAIR